MRGRASHRAGMTCVMTQPHALRCISTRDAADLLTVARSTLYRMIERGDLQATKVGGRTVILETELARFLEENKVRPSAFSASVRVV